MNYFIADAFFVFADSAGEFRRQFRCDSVFCVNHRFLSGKYDNLRESEGEFRGKILFEVDNTTPYLFFNKPLLYNKTFHLFQRPCLELFCYMSNQYLTMNA